MIPFNHNGIKGKGKAEMHFHNEKEKQKPCYFLLMVIAVEMTMVIKMLLFLKHFLSVRQETWSFTNFNSFKSAENCFRKKKKKSPFYQQGKQR